MKSFIYTITFVLLATLVSSEVVDNNKFIDQVVTALKTQHNLDPLTIGGGHKHEFHRLIGLHQVNGEVVVHSTRIVGLSAAHRIGDAKLDNKNGSFAAQVRLGDSNVKAFGSVSIYAGGHTHPELRIEADIGDVSVNFSVDVGADGKAVLNHFEVDQFKNVRFHVQGLLLLDPLIDVVADAYVALFNSQARQLLTDNLKPIIEQQLKELKVHSF